MDSHFRRDDRVAAYAGAARSAVRQFRPVKPDAKFCRDVVESRFKGWVLPKVLLNAAILVREDPGNLDYMNDVTRTRLRELAGGTFDLADDSVFRNVMVALRRDIGSDEMQRALGLLVRGTKRAMDVELAKPRDEDVKDMHRIWGWKLLPDDDPIFSDPEYFYFRQALNGQRGTGTFFQSEDYAGGLFASEWQKLAPKGSRVLRFTITGSQANNLVFDIARTNLPARFREQVWNTDRQANFLVFTGAWVATDGSMASHFHGATPDDTSMAARLMIESPLTDEPDPKDPEEIARLKPVEDQALKSVENKVLRGKDPVGAVFIEPILASGGVKFYRTEFLIKLRELCDELHVPIVADEIFTGGGRTGKFSDIKTTKGSSPISSPLEKVCKSQVSPQLIEKAFSSISFLRT